MFDWLLGSSDSLVIINILHDMHSCNWYIFGLMVFICMTTLFDFQRYDLPGPASWTLFCNLILTPYHAHTTLSQLFSVGDFNEVLIKSTSQYVTASTLLASHPSASNLGPVKRNPWLLRKKKNGLLECKSRAFYGSILGHKESDERRRADMQASWRSHSPGRSQPRFSSK